MSWVVDHIDGNPRNNAPENIRLVEVRENLSRVDRFAIATNMLAENEACCAAASDALRRFSEKGSPLARAIFVADFRIAFAQLRRFSSWYRREFAAELAAQRRARAK